MKIEEELRIAINSGLEEKIVKAYEKIYDSYFKLGMFVARQYLDKESAIDIVDDIFVSFFEMILNKNGRDIKNIKQYICSSIKNASIKEANKLKKTIMFDENINYIESNHLLINNQLLQELDEMEQYIITEHILIGKAFREIGEELNKPTNTIKSTYRRAIQKAKRSLTWIKK